MSVSVLVLYPPPSLSAARVARDLADQHYSPHPLRWLNLQEDPSDSIRSSTPNRTTHVLDGPSRINTLPQSTPKAQTAIGGRPDKILFNSTAITPDASTRRIERNKGDLRARKSSRSVTFDLTHEIAAIPVFEASLDDVEEDPNTTTGKTVPNGAVASGLENSGFLGSSGFSSSKKRKHESMFVRQDSILQQSVTTAKTVSRNSAASVNGPNASRTRSKLSRSTLPVFASQQESSQEQTARESQLDDIDQTRDPKLPPDAYNMDADDEDSHPVRKTRYRSSSTTIPHRQSIHQGSTVNTRPSHARSTQSMLPSNSTHQSPRLVEKDYAVPEFPLHDITNFSYAGAVDSQGHSSRKDSQDTPNGEKGSYDGNPERNRPPKGETQGETQFSGGSQSWQGATYQSYRPAAPGLSGAPATAITSTMDQPASFAPQHNLPILNIKTLSHMSDLRDGAMDAHAQQGSSGLDLLAVVFEVGELKDIPRRRNERPGMYQGPEGNLRLCNVKICQPNTGGYPKMTVMDLTLWGDMAEQVSNGDYRLIKGDVVWLKNLQFKPASKGQDCSLSSRSTPPSDYRIFYRTYPRVISNVRRGPRPTAEEIIDQQLRVIDKMTAEPGTRRALQLAQWIVEEWQHHAR